MKKALGPWGTLIHSLRRYGAMITDALRCSQNVSNILLSHLRIAWLDMALPVLRLQSNLQPVNGMIYHIRHARLSVVSSLCHAL